MRILRQLRLLLASHRQLSFDYGAILCSALAASSPASTSIALAVVLLLASFALYRALSTWLVRHVVD